MQVFLGCLAIALATEIASATETIDEILCLWSTTQKDAESLVIEFELETYDRTFDDRKKEVGSARILRTRRGKVNASYDSCSYDRKGNLERRSSYLLYENSIYIIYHDRKIAERLDLADAEILPYIENIFLPLVVLVDQERAKSRYTMEIAKQNDLYLVLKLTPKRSEKTETPAEKRSWLDAFTFSLDSIITAEPSAQMCSVVVMKTDSNVIPKGMPRSLRCSEGGIDYHYDIKSWQINHINGPKVEEFIRPEDFEGWTVHAKPESGQ